jgi:hypothetical protein
VLRTAARSTSCLYRVWFSRRRAPCFRRHERAVDEPFGEVAPAERDQIRGQAMGDVGEDAGLDPVLEAPMTGLVGRIVVRQVLPAGAGAQDPEDALQHAALVAPGAAAAVGAAGGSGISGSNTSHCSSVKRMFRAILRGRIDCPSIPGFMRPLVLVASRGLCAWKLRMGRIPGNRTQPWPAGVTTFTLFTLNLPGERGNAGFQDR